MSRDDTELRLVVNLLKFFTIKNTKRFDNEPRARIVHENTQKTIEKTLQTRVIHKHTYGRADRQ